MHAAVLHLLPQVGWVHEGLHVLGALPHRHRRDNVRIVHVAEEPVRDLAVCSPRAPFILWAAMALLGLAALGFLRRDKPEARPVG